MRTWYGRPGAIWVVQWPGSRAWRLAWLVVVLVALSACVRDATPEEVARRDLERMSPGVVLTGWTVHLTQPWQDGVLIIASFGWQPGSSEHLSVSCTFVRHTWGGWQVQRSDSVGGTPRPPLVMYGSTDVMGTPVVYGRVLAAEVGFVEATFDTGFSVRAAPLSDGFALLGPGAERLVELRVLDAAGGVLGRYTQLSLMARDAAR